MKFLIKYKLVLLAVLTFTLLVVPLADSANALIPGEGADSKSTAEKGFVNEANKNEDKNINDPTAGTRCDSSTGVRPDSDEAANCIFDKYINPAIYLLSALVGVSVVISIIVGGIQYASSAGDPTRATAAKKRITNAIIALVAFFFLFAFVQWIVPGGIV